MKRLLLVSLLCSSADPQDATRQGVYVVVEPERDTLPVEFAKTGPVVDVQLGDEARVATIRRLAENAGLLGTRIHVDRGSPGTLHPPGPSAFALADGKPLWTVELRGAPMGWGPAVDAQARIIVSLQDGRVLCLGR